MSITSYFELSPLISATCSSSKPSICRTVSKIGANRCTEKISRNSTHCTVRWELPFWSAFPEKSSKNSPIMTKRQNKFAKTNTYYKTSRTSRRVQLSSHGFVIKLNSPNLFPCLSKPVYDLSKLFHAPCYCKILYHKSGSENKLAK